METENSWEKRRKFIIISKFLNIGLKSIIIMIVKIKKEILLLQKHLNKKFIKL